jgi:tetratricopeptide (TPR) repeat protein
MLVTGNLEEARKTAEAWARMYPREAIAHMMLSGYVNKFPGRFEDAAREAAKAVELDPGFGIGYYNLGVNNAYMGRLKEADDALRLANTRGPEIDEFLMLAYDLAFLRNDAPAMAQVSERARARQGPESWISHKESLALAYFGHLQQARSMSRRAVAEARQGDQRERVGLWEAGAAVREALFGHVREAKERAAAALSVSKDREVAYGAGVALAVAGDSFQSKRIADDLERRFPEDATIRFSYLPVLRAWTALNSRQPEKALSLLEEAVPFELGAPNSINFGFGALYPAYVRGKSYLALHKDAMAATEFRKVLDHRGIVVSDPAGALARLELGRAIAASGDKAGARDAYREFLGLWKDADPEIPVLVQAKAEFARL